MEKQQTKEKATTKTVLSPVAILGMFVVKFRIYHKPSAQRGKITQQNLKQQQTKQKRGWRGMEERWQSSS